MWQRAPDSSHTVPGTQSGQPLEHIFWAQRVGEMGYFMYSPNSYYGSFKHTRKFKNIMMITYILHLIFFFFFFFGFKACGLLVP